MAGLTLEGFFPDSIENIKSRIEVRLEALNSGFDFSPESPDGQLIGIMSAELALLWKELNNVYNTYDPDVATGKSLRNIAKLTGIEYRTATRSTTVIKLTGAVGTIVPEGSLVSSIDGYVFYTHNTVTIVADTATPLATTGYVEVLAIASKAGAVPVKQNSISVIESVVLGWDGVEQANAGVTGLPAQDEQSFRNLRNRTVLRNSNSVEESIVASLTSFGIEQVFVYNNDSDSIGADLVTPARSIHVTVGGSGKSDLEIATEIYKVKGLTVPTYGTTTVNVNDSLGFSHPISFSKAVQLDVYLNLDITFLSTEVGGAIEAITDNLLGHFASLRVGEDIIWSQLFALITPYGNAQINGLTLSTDNVTFNAANVPVTNLQFARLHVGNLNLTVT